MKFHKFYLCHCALDNLERVGVYVDNLVELREILVFVQDKSADGHVVVALWQVQLEHLVDLHATPLNVRVELNDVTLLLDIVQEGQSISLLSASTLYHRPLLKAVPLDIPQNRMMGCIHLLKKAYRKKSAEVFLRMLSESSEVSAHNNR